MGYVQQELPSSGDCILMDYLRRSDDSAPRALHEIEEDIARLENLLEVTIVVITIAIIIMVILCCLRVCVCV